MPMIQKTINGVEYAILDEVYKNAFKDIMLLEQGDTTLVVLMKLGKQVVIDIPLKKCIDMIGGYNEELLSKICDKGIPFLAMLIPYKQI